MISEWSSITDGIWQEAHWSAFCTQSRGRSLSALHWLLKRAYSLQNTEHGLFLSPQRYISSRITNPSKHLANKSQWVVLAVTQERTRASALASNLRERTQWGEDVHGRSCLTQRCSQLESALRPQKGPLSIDSIAVSQIVPWVFPLIFFLAVSAR